MRSCIQNEVPRPPCCSPSSPHGLHNLHTEQHGRFRHQSSSVRFMDERLSAFNRTHRLQLQWQYSPILHCRRASHMELRSQRIRQLAWAAHQGFPESISGRLHGAWISRPVLGQGTVRGLHGCHLHQQNRPACDRWPARANPSSRGRRHDRNPLLQSSVRKLCVDALHGPVLHQRQ